MTTRSVILNPPRRMKDLSRDSSLYHAVKQNVCFRIALGITLLIPCLLSPADAKPSRPAPIAVCEESEYFFGAVPNTETISHDFILTNDGVSPLHISAVRTDCGCVLARLDNDTLAPGESVTLKAKFGLKGRSGKQMRRIIIESNDPEQPRLVLALVGEALAQMEIVPDRIYWGNIHLAAVAEKSCEIRFSEGDESYINSVIAPDPAFVTELISVKPRRVYKLVIRTVPPLRPGSFQSTVRLLTDHPRFKILEIPMQGRIVGDIYTIPGEMIIASSDKRKNSRSLLVCSGLKKKFKLLKVELPAPEMKSNIRSLAMGGGWRIDLRDFTPSQDLDGANIVIFTDSETMPVLNVPIRTTGTDDLP